MTGVTPPSRLRVGLIDGAWLVVPAVANHGAEDIDAAAGQYSARRCGFPWAPRAVAVDAAGLLLDTGNADKTRACLRARLPRRARHCPMVRPV